MFYEYVHILHHLAYLQVTNIEPKCVFEKVRRLYGLEDNGEAALFVGLRFVKTIEVTHIGIRLLPSWVLLSPCPVLQFGNDMTTEGGSTYADQWVRIQLDCWQMIGSIELNSFIGSVAYFALSVNNVNNES